MNQIRMAGIAAALASFAFAGCAGASEDGPFQPTMESLAAHYEIPEWYQDAKFGIFAHWGPQCQAEAGDWYARNMYLSGGQHNFHKKKYGDPKVYGFKEIIRDWKGEKWEPEKLAALYKRMGAKYVVTMAQHHDNFDLWDSTHQEWNSTRLGPKRNIIADWKKAIEGEGLRWGVSIHASHAWCWYEPARNYDGLLTKEDGEGTWWDEMGLDPQELYAQNHEASKNNRHWDWDPKQVTPPSKEYREKFMKRHKELIDKYHPDIFYYDDTVVPFWPLTNDGVELTAYFYNQMYRFHKNKQDVVACGKILNPEQRHALVWDVERGAPGRIVRPYWQTDTCIGSWHYDRGMYERNRYKSADRVIRMLLDVVAKGGNMLLSVPIRGDGTIDEKELAICEKIGDWMRVNGEGVYGTRLWKVYGEGPQAEGPELKLNEQGFNEGKGPAPTPKDIRYTAKGKTVYAFTLGVPTETTVLKSFADEKVKSVSMLGTDKPVQWKQENGLLSLSAPDKDSGLSIAVGYKIELE